MIEFVHEHFIPVKINVREQPKIARQFNILWTPTLVMLDRQEFRLRQSVGFLPPDELIPELLMALAMNQIRIGSPQNAAVILEELQADYQEAKLIPEALYWRGISIFFANQDKSELFENWKRIALTYPDSQWAVKTTLLNSFDDSLWPPLG